LDEISEITILLILLFSFDYNTKIQNLKELDFHVHVFILLKLIMQIYRNV